MSPKPRISRGIVMTMLKQGKKPAEIAKELGETRQAINWVINHQGTSGVKTALQVARESIPWINIQSEHKKSATWARIVNHAEYMATGGRGMSHRKLEMLNGWYNNLERTNVVVYYDPEIPPAPNAKYGGWGYAAREDRDGGLLLRVNDYVEMTDEAYELWRLPERRPEA